MFLCLPSFTASSGEGCSGTVVSIFGQDRVVPAENGFNVSCKFHCLRPQHIAQLWRDRGYEVDLLQMLFKALLHHELGSFICRLNCEV